MSGLLVSEAPTRLVLAPCGESEGATLTVGADAITLIADGERGLPGERGAPGRDGKDSDGATDPGDLTLLFNNRLI